MRILIADDNSAVRRSLRQLLTEPGRELLEAENGQRAVDLALEHRPDIAVLDLAMPLMDGLQAAREIHQHLPELPIVMYTMHWSSQLQVEAMKSGISRVVAKADSASLVAAVQELVKAVPAEASIQPLDPIAIPPQTPLALPAIEAAPADASETTGAPADDPAEPDEPIPPAS